MKKNDLGSSYQNPLVGFLQFCLGVNNYFWS
jgi:hypothetical protein